MHLSRSFVNSSRLAQKLLTSQIIKCQSTAATTCPHLIGDHQEENIVNDSDKFLNAKPYSEVPGPKPLPILGNTWRYV